MDRTPPGYREGADDPPLGQQLEARRPLGRWLSLLGLGVATTGLSAVAVIAEIHDPAPSPMPPPAITESADDSLARMVADGLGHGVAQAGAGGCVDDPDTAYDECDISAEATSMEPLPTFPPRGAPVVDTPTPTPTPSPTPEPTPTGTVTPVPAPSPEEAPPVNVATCGTAEGTGGIAGIAVSVGGAASCTGDGPSAHAGFPATSTPAPPENLADAVLDECRKNIYQAPARCEGALNVYESLRPSPTPTPA